MPIDPTIFARTYQPVDPAQTLGQILRIRGIRQEQQLRDQQMQAGKQVIQENQYKLADLGRQQADRATMDNAATAAYQPQQATLQQPTVSLGGTDLPGGQSTVQGPAAFNRQAYTNAIPPGNLRMQAEQGFASQDAAQQAARVEMATKLSALTKADQENLKTHLELIGQKAQSFLALPPEMKAQVYPSLKQDLETSHSVQPGLLPDQYDPKLDQAFQAVVTQGTAIKDQLEAQGKVVTAKETAREHDLAHQDRLSGQALTKRGQDITVRGQNLVNDRALESNAQKFGEAPLTPAQQDLVDQIGTGKMPLTRLDYLATRNPGLLSAVSARYPEFDGAKIKSYVDATKDFTSGTTSKQVNAGATALGHLQELRELNTAASHIPHTPAWTRYQNKVDTLATELAKFYGDATIPAINSIKETLSSTLPGNRDAAIQTQAQSMGDKFDSFEQQWKNAAPSSKYQAEMPGMSTKAKAARAALDPNYKAGQTAATPNSPQSGDFFGQFGGQKR
jgi:hypothetical protein